MKISNSKKELARIISESGGWNAKADFAAQGGDGFMSFFSGKQRPKRKSSEWMDFGESAHIGGVFLAKIQNWHQSILSRSEYFHLYPAQDADGWDNLGSSVARDLQLSDGRINTGSLSTKKQTIEQLAADYRNAKDYAERKQQEADAAKADADEKLRVLEIAGEAHGLLVTPITTKQEPELVITRFTGKFHSTKHGDQPSSFDAICDGCGKRFGTHVGFDCRP